MAKKSKKKRIDGSESAAGFGHNPFAAALNLTPPEPEAKAAAQVDASGFDWGAVEKVVLRREKKGRGGKTVTLVQGLGISTESAGMFAKELKKALGVGVSVEGEDLVVQGDQRDRIEPMLKKKGASNIVRSG